MYYSNLDTSFLLVNVQATWIFSLFLNESLCSFVTENKYSQQPFDVHADVLSKLSLLAQVFITSNKDDTTDYVNALHKNELQAIMTFPFDLHCQPLMPKPTTRLFHFENTTDTRNTIFTHLFKEFIIGCKAVYYTWKMGNKVRDSLLTQYDVSIDAWDFCTERQFQRLSYFP